MLKNRQSTFLKFALCAASLSFFASCQKGFQSTPLSTLGSSTNSSTGGSANSPNVTTPGLASLNLSGIQAQGDSPGRLLVTLDAKNQALIVSIPLPALAGGISLSGLLNGNKQVDFPSLPGAFLFLQPSGQLALSIPLKDVVRNASLLQGAAAQTLPNGDPLPAFPSGEGAHYGLTIDGQHQVSLYLGVKAVALFVETPELDKILTCSGLPICLPLGPWAIKNKVDGQIVGYLAFVYAKTNASSGVFVTTELPDSLATFIDNNI